MSSAWLYVAGTVIFTVCAQLILKGQVDDVGELPGSASERIDFLMRLLVRPWVVAALLMALAGALCWMVALTRLDLSRAYPFMGLSFVLVLLGSAFFFSESLSIAKVAGVALLCLGLLVGSR